MLPLDSLDGAGDGPADGRQAGAAIRQLDPAWHDSLRALEAATLRGPLSPRIARLVWLAIHASITSLDRETLRECIRAARDSGASKEETLAVLQLCTVLGIHAMAVAVPILKESLETHRASIENLTGAAATPAIDRLRSEGLFNSAWKEIEDWDPVWLDRFLAAGMSADIRSVLGQRTIELLYIAIDASVTHLYAPGTRRHMVAALQLGVEPEEILQVLKIASFQSMASMRSGARILLEEVA